MNTNENNIPEITRPTLSTAAAVIIAVACAAVGGLFASGALGGMLALSVSSALFAVLYMLVPSPWLLCSAPLAYGFGLLLGAGYIGSAFAVAYIPSGLVIAYAITHKKSAAITTALLSALYAAVLVCNILLVIYIHYGSVSPGIDEWLRDFEKLASENFEMISKAAIEAGGEAYDTAAFSEYIRQAVSNLPGIFAVYMTAFAWLTVAFTRRLLGIFRVKHYFIPKGFPVILPRSWGIMFFMIGIAAVALPDQGSYSLLRYSAVNLLMLFMVTLAAWGISKVLRRMLRPELSPLTKVAAVFGAVFIFLIFGVAIISAASLFGAVSVIVEKREKIQ